MATDRQILRTGTALSVTVGAAYITCALFFWLWPELAMNLMNALFHGLEFRRIQGGGGTFNFSGFAYPLVIMMVWAFVLGVLFAWLKSWHDGLERG